MTRPGPPVSIQKATALKLGIPNSEVVQSIHEWRRKIRDRDFPNAIFGPSGILGDGIVSSLASVGPILSLIQLEKVVGESWPWFGKYGDELLEELEKLSIPPLQPKPKQARGQKKALDDQEEDERSAKRSRTNRTVSSKKATQNPALGMPVAPVSHFPPTTPLPHNPYTHLLAPTGSSPGSSPYLGHHPPNYMYFYNTTPHSGSPIISTQYHSSSNIASSSGTPFPRINDQFRHYSPKN